jgi:hypothetical protein
MALWHGTSMEEVFASMSPEDRKVMGEGSADDAGKLLRLRADEADRRGFIESNKRFQEQEARRLATPHKVKPTINTHGQVVLRCDRCLDFHMENCPAAKEWLAEHTPAN